MLSRTSKYAAVLSEIHDEGFRWYAESAAPHILKILAAQGITSGLVVDLGCGSGRWAQSLIEAGYEVLGIDQSPAMLRLTKQNAPGARTQLADLYDAKLPPCAAITSMGECLNYCFAGKPGVSHLRKLFARAYRALRPGGALVIDFATPDRAPAGEPRLYFAESPRWSILSRTTGDASKQTLQREAIVFRKEGATYRRSVEVHNLRLFEPETIGKELSRCGFNVTLKDSFGDYPLPPGMAVAVAVKPAEK